MDTGPWNVNLTQPINATADWAAVRDKVRGLRQTGVKTMFPFSGFGGVAGKGVMSEVGSIGWEV